MKKIIIAVVVVGIILIVALYAEKNTAIVKDSPLPTPETMDPSPVATLKKPPYRQEEPQRFVCDEEKKFNLEIVSVQNSPGPGDDTASPQEVRLARITFDNSSQEISLRQSNTDPHYYQLPGISLSVEGDEASLDVNGEKYTNCVSVKR